MNGPDQSIQRELLPHLHLRSANKYPLKQQVHTQQIADWLRQASEIVNSRAPVYWTYLNCPADGTIMLTWQVPSMGGQFASDGYMWPPQESHFQMDAGNGQVLEMLVHKSGYAPDEAIAVHARRRYRLVNAIGPTSAPPVDENLWLTHYSAAEFSDRVSSSTILINDQRTQATIQTRSHLQQQGQIVHQEFMLRDRAKWPHIAFPNGWSRAPPQMTAGPGVRVPQNMAYPPQGIASGPPPKRMRPNPAEAAGPMTIIEDDEDTHLGDFFDHITPREISMMRFRQNTRWMEEILLSPYTTNQITPVDLGLGLTGDMASLTQGIFHAPASGHANDPNMYDYVGKLDGDKADQFRSRVQERLQADQSELRIMEKKHAKRMAKLRQGMLVAAAEKSLRAAVHDPADQGYEIWRLEGRMDSAEDGGESKTAAGHVQRVDDIMAQVERSLGRHAAAVKELLCLQNGGLLTAATINLEAQDVEMSAGGNGADAGLNNDFDTQTPEIAMLDNFSTAFSSESTPREQSAATPVVAATVAAPVPGPAQPKVPPTPEPAHANLPEPVTTVSTASPPRQNPSASEDSAQGTTTSSDAAATASAAEDWVIVPQGGASPEGTHSKIDVAAATAGIEHLAQSTTPPVAAIPTSAVPPASMPAVVAAQAGAAAGEAGVSADEKVEREASAAVDAAGVDLGLGDDDVGMDMGLDDSAFGDAFGGGETPDAGA